MDCRTELRYYQHIIRSAYMVKKQAQFPANLEIDYPGAQSRLKTLFRGILVLPILFILALISGGGSGSGNESAMNESNQQMLQSSGGGIAFGLFAATALMIVFRQVYPLWWFTFNLELKRFTTRIGAYILLLTDKYPSTVDAQSVHLDVQYPDVKKDLNQLLPLVKWILAIPHFVVLIVLAFGILGATVIAWFAILITGKYPKELFEFVVGYQRWSLRLSAYAVLLTTDQYPPFSLKK